MGLFRDQACRGLIVFLFLPVLLVRSVFQPETGLTQSDFVSVLG